VKLVDGGVLGLNLNWWFGMMLNFSDSGSSFLRSIFSKNFANVGRREIDLWKDGISSGLSGFEIRIMFGCFHSVGK